MSAADGVRVDVASSGIVKYVGITIAETGGGVAHIRIRENSASGRILDTIKLSAGQSVSAWYGPDSKRCSGDLYEEHVTGTYEGSVFVQ